jgi:hypothetical protein
MRALLDRFNGPLHGLAGLLAAWLLLSSPWVELYRSVPADAGLVTRAHVALGLLAAPIAALYLVACTIGGRWRLYFPWLVGDIAPLARDIAGLVRGRRPMSEGGGLLASIEGLLLLALVLSAVSGAVWFALQSSGTALSWRDVHIACARTCAVLALAHLAGVALHLVDLLRG